MQVVSNTTPLCELFKIEQLALLKETYGSLIIPSEVKEELRRSQDTVIGLYQTVSESDWVSMRKIEQTTVLDALRQRYPKVDLGEAAAIVLAQELSADLLLLDDADARAAAVSEGLTITGTLGTLVTAYETKRISDTQAQQILGQLYRGSFHIGETLYHKVRQRLGLSG